MAVKISEKIGYGFGDMASSMFWKFFGAYLMLFYTDVFGLSAAVVGTMFLVTRIWDSVFDPIVGVVADRTETRFGKFRPFLLWLALPFGVIGAFTFFTPEFGSAGKIVYAYLTYSLMMMVYSAINVPYASLLGVMSPEPADRNVLSTFRMTFAYLGSFIALFFFEKVVEAFGGAKILPDGTPNPVEMQQSAWFEGVTCFAVVCVLLFLGCFYCTRERVKPIKAAKTSLRSDLSDLVHNHPWWILLGAGVASLVFNSIRDGATVYYFKYFVDEDVVGKCSIFGTSFALSALYLGIGQLSNIIGVVAAAPVSNLIGKKRTFLGAMVIAAVLSFVFYTFDKDQLGLIFTFQVLISICAGSIFPLLWSMYADCADYSELRTGNRATGLIFSSSSMSQKFGWAIGSAVTGWLLSAFGYVPNAVQSPDTIDGIKMCLSILPAIGCLLSVVCIWFYPLTEQTVRANALKLEEMRKK